MLYVLVLLLAIVLLIFIDTTIWFPDVSDLMYIEDCPGEEGSPQSVSEPVLTPTASAVAADTSVDCLATPTSEQDIAEQALYQTQESIPDSVEDFDIPELDGLTECPDVSMFSDVDIYSDLDEQECSRGASAAYGGGAKAEDISKLLNKLKRQVGEQVYAGQ